MTPPPDLAADGKVDLAAKAVGKDLFAYTRSKNAPTNELAEIKALPGKSEPVGAEIDRTAKLFIGGKQARPDSGYSTPVFSTKGKLLAQVGQGNRKDIRNAVEAAAVPKDGEKPPPICVPKFFIISGKIFPPVKTSSPNALSV